MATTSDPRDYADRTIAGGADASFRCTIGPTCYVCGSSELAPDADLRSPTCNECAPAREHVVSMQTGKGGVAAAVCPCGWHYESQFVGKVGNMFREVAVLSHWRFVIARAAEVQS